MKGDKKMKRITLKLKQVLWFTEDSNILVILNYGEEDNEKCILNGVDYFLTESDVVNCFKEWGETNVVSICSLIDECGLPFLRIDVE